MSLTEKYHIQDRSCSLCNIPALDITTKSNDLSVEMLQLNTALTWIVCGHIIHCKRLRGIVGRSCGTFAFVRCRSVVAIIDQDREQNHQQHLENTADDGKFQAHFLFLAVFNSAMTAVVGSERHSLNCK